MFNISTECKSCHFYTGNSCNIGALEKFRERGEVSVDSFDNHIVNRVCQFRTYQEASKEEAMNRAFPRINYIIVHRGENSLSDLSKTIKSLDSAIRVGKDKYRIIITHTENVSSKDIYEFTTSKTSLKISLVVKCYNDDYDMHIVDKGFDKSKNGYVVIIDSGKEIPEDFEDVLGKALNVKMEKVLAITDINCYMAVLYNHLKGNKELSINDKISQIKEFFGQEKKTVFTMKELYEIVND